MAKVLIADVRGAVKALEEMGQDPWTTNHIAEWLSVPNDDEDSKRKVCQCIYQMATRDEIQVAETKAKPDDNGRRWLKQYSTSLKTIAKVDGKGKYEKKDEEQEKQEEQSPVAQQTVTFEEIGKGIYNHIRQLNETIKGLQHTIEDNNEVIEFHEKTIKGLNEKITILNKHKKECQQGRHNGGKVPLSEIARFT
jgi:hypothetical protein